MIVDLNEDAYVMSSCDNDQLFPVAVSGKMYENSCGNKVGVVMKSTKQFMCVSLGCGVLKQFKSS